jgi:Fur family ferric uptake transcriptional regulator
METKARSTKQKRLVWAVFEKTLRPLSPAEVHSEVVADLPRMSLATVYRILKALQDEQKLVAVSLPGAPDRYEMKLRADTHHHHFYCEGCGKVFDVPGCGLRVDSRVPAGFSISRHEVTLYGNCDDCGV